MISALDDRIETLRERLKHNGAATDRMAGQRKDVYARVYGETKAQPIVVRRAKALAAFLREKDLLIFEEDVLAGFSQFYDFAEPLDMPYLDHPALEELPDDLWCPAGVAGGADPAEMLDFCRGFHIGLFSAALGGHVIAGYDRVIASGLGAMIDAARERLATAKGQARSFVAASLRVCEAASDYLFRYAAEAERQAGQTSVSACRQQLQAISVACQHVASERPRTFFEAAQLVVLTHEIITAEQGSGSLSPGRLDQYLFPFYRDDIEAGRLTADEAEEIVQALWLKLGALKNAYQNVTLGGCNADGVFMGNDLTLMGLRASARLKMDQPLVSFRWCESMPEGFWGPVLDLVGEGLGFPAMFNDAVVIDAKFNVGLSREDATNYGVVGCVEMTAGGKEWSQTEAIRINWAKALELMLNGGCCTLTGTQTAFRPARPLAELTTFEAFVDSYKRVFERMVDMAAEWTIVRDRGYPLVWPFPFLSSTMAGCLEAGRDVTAGGTTYNLLTMNNCGMADVADSLMAIRRLVYEEQSLTLAELAEALRKNFDGAESLHARLTDSAERFGNDADGPDLIVKELAELLHERLARYRNARSGGYQVGMYTVSAHAHMGSATGALPSGRAAGVSLANGFSPCQGADVSGPTAVARSLTKLDHRQFGNGVVVDLKFSPSLLAQPQGRQAIRKLIETYFDLGGLEIQFNVVDRKTLMAAQAKPEEFRDLVVRVSGFSAYFVDLDKVCQNEIIARTEHGRV